MLVLEPIPELSALLLSAKMARFPFPEVAQAIAAAETRSRTPSSDRAGWKSFYKDVVSLLIPQLLEAQRRVDQDKHALQDQQGQRLSIERVSMAVQGALQTATNEWQARLQEQDLQLVAKMDRAVETLAVTSEPDKATGELVFVFEPQGLEAFWEWLRRAEQQWADNNGNLVKIRAQEAIAPLLGSVAFEVKPAQVQVPALAPMKMRGERIPEPSFFQSLGATYRTVMTAVTAVSGLGFFLSRTITLEDFGKKVLTIVSLLVFLGATVYAAITIPKERKQSMARLIARSRLALARELTSAAKTRLSQVATSQRTQLSRHLAAETARFKLGATTPGGPVMGAAASPLAGGLMPADVAKLGGQWKAAIEKHLTTFPA